MDEALELSVLDIASGHMTTFQALRASRALVIDFWHTKCVRCPAALEKLNSEAAMRKDVLFAACALSQGAENLEIVQDVIRL